MPSDIMPRAADRRPLRPDSASAAAIPIHSTPWSANRVTRGSTPSSMGLSQVAALPNNSTSAARAGSASRVSMRRTLPAVAGVIRASLGLELVGDAHEALPEQCGQLVNDDMAGGGPLVPPPVARGPHPARGGMRPDQRPGRGDPPQLWVPGARR